MDGIQWIGSPNYTPGRSGVNHITLHIMAGGLNGTDSTFLNPSTAASATYGIGSDGSIHQYVSEDDTPWSDGNAYSNASTISIEHEGGLDGFPCTQQCMDASAMLMADIARRHGWTRLTHDGTKGNVWLHREVPGSTHPTCPDLAPNGLDVEYVVTKANQYLGGPPMIPGKDEDMQAIIQINDTQGLWYFDGTRLHGIQHPDELEAVQIVARATTGKELPTVKLGTTKAPFGTRFMALLGR